MDFEQFAKTTSLPGVDPRQLDAALRAMGPEAHRVVEKDSFDGVARQVGCLVRNIRGLGVEDAAHVERELLRRAGAVPGWIGKDFQLDSAVGVIAARGYLRAVLVLLGFDWSHSMLVQSSCSELCRFATGFKHAVLRVTASEAHAEISLHAPGLSRVTLEGARPVLTGLFEQARNYQVRTTKDGQEFVFSFATQQQRGNAA